jgi:replication factor A1
MEEKMEIKDLKPRIGNVEVEGVVADKGDVREFDKFGKKGRVCNVTLNDDTGRVSLTLWNDDVDKVGVGDKVKIANGYVGEYNGEMQLGTGKFGKLEVVEKAKEKPKEYKDELPEERMTEEEDVGEDGY